MNGKKIYGLITCALLSFTVVFSAACGRDKNSGSGSSSSGDIVYEETGGKKTLKDSSVVLCESGTSGYKVVIDKDATVSERWAANELVTYIKNSTGAELPVVYENTLSDVSNKSKLISVGDTQMFKDKGIGVTQEEITTDGYKIVRDENVVYICGNTDWGTSYGVMEFLNLEVGYEPYTSDEIYYEKKDVLYVKEFGTYVDIPAFESRAMDGLANYDMETSYRLRTVGYYGAEVEKFGGMKAKHWIPNSGHTVTAILPQADYPQYYGASQICLTNENVIKDVVANLKKLILAQPEGYIVMFGQEDGKSFCNGTECDCARQISKYRVSGYIVNFMNTIIEQLEEWREAECPERYLIYCTFAYGETLIPPVEENTDGSYKILGEACRPHEKLYIMLAQNTCPMHPFDDTTCSSNTNGLKQLKQWSFICPRLIIWDYAAYYQCYLPFYNDIDKIQNSYQWYKKLGAINVFTELNSGGQFTMFGWLRMYLRGKCLWDPDQNINELIDNFFENYYKDAAGKMREVYELYRNHQKALDTAKGLHSMAPTKELWPRNVVDRAKAIILEALEICDNMTDAGLGDKLRLRIEEELACVELLQVLFYQDYDYDMNEFDAFVSAFEQKTLDMGITKYREHESMASFLAGVKST